MKTLNKTLLLAVIAAFGFAGSASAAIIGHWELEAGSGTTAFDVSGSANTHDGTITGAAWETTDLPAVPSGTSAKLSFSEGSENRVAVSNHTDLSVNESGDTATIAFWFFADAGADNNSAHLFGKNDEYSVRLLDDGNTVRLRMDLFGSNSGGNGVGIAEGQWHHAAAAWTGGGDGTLYLNGAEYDSWTGGSASVATTSELTFGNRQFFGYPNPFAGDLDDLRLYDTVLTQSEIQALAVVPEPSAFALLAGCFGLTWVMLRRRS